MYSNYISTSDLLSFCICNTDEQEFSSIWKFISYSNDVMNHVDRIIKREGNTFMFQKYPWYIISVFKTIRGISRKKYIIAVIACVFR